MQIATSVEVGDKSGWYLSMSREDLADIRLGQLADTDTTTGASVSASSSTSSSAVVVPAGGVKLL